MKHRITGAQKQIYDMCSYGGKQVACIPVSVPIKAEYDYHILLKSVNELFKRNGILRAKIISEKAGIYQYIEEYQPIEQLCIKEFQTEKEYGLWASEYAKQGIDITGKLYRICGFKVGDRWGLMIVLHHIISDGWTFLVIAKKLNYYYKCFQQNIEIEDDAQKFEDYTKQYENYLSSRKMEVDKKYWRDVCVKDYPSAKLSEKVVTDYTSDRIELSINKELGNSIVSYCNQQKCSLNILFTTAYGYYFKLLLNQSEFFVGTTLLDRNDKKLQNSIGMYVNVVPLLIKIQGKTLRENFKNVKEGFYNAFKHQKYNYTTICSELNIKKLFDVTISFQVAYSRLDEEIMDEIIWYSQGAQNEDLVINVVNMPDGSVNVKYDYLVNKFSKEEIELFHQRVMNIICEEIDGRENLSFLSPREEERILNEFNQTAKATDTQVTITKLFERKILSEPDKLAAICGKEQITYRELGRRTDILANLLRQYEVKPDERVVLMTDRSIEMIIAIYGVLKAGGAFVPIDPSAPIERIQYIIGDCQPKVILTFNTCLDDSITNKLGDSIQVVSLENEEIWLNQDIVLTTQEKVEVGPENLAYCIYTSGTTGKPKGVMLEHRNLMHYITHAIDNYFFDTEVIPLFTNYCFDLTITTIFGFFLSGAVLEIMTGNAVEDTQAIFSSKNITFAKMTPSHLRIAAQMPENKESKINTLILGGEELDTITCDIILNKFGNDIKIHNEYGPTEATVGCCDYIYQPNIDNGKAVSIGKPIHNTQIYIMKQNLLCGILVPGEICIGGAGVARGYLNREQLTKEKFVDNPFAEGRMYRTGDLGMWMPDGRIEFLGRIDEQVKIRGYRIELGEICSVIRSDSRIKDCRVIAKENENGEKILLAYVVSDQPLDISEFKESLREKLPEYMIPSYLMKIDKIPLTANGKIDKRMLPEITMEVEDNYVEPVTPLEHKLCMLFSEILGVKRVGIRDSFFELGGHSLTATKLINRIAAELEITVPIRVIFDYPTVERLARQIEKEKKIVYQSIPKAKVKEYYPMSSAQKRIFLICEMSDVGVAYNMPMIFRLSGNVQPERIKKAFALVVKQHQILRTRFLFVGGRPMQQILDNRTLDYHFFEDDETEEKLLIDNFIHPFVLSEGNVIRMQLVRRSQDYLLMLDMHHIVGDAVGVAVFLRAFTQAYNQTLVKNDVMQYVDYSEWMRTRNLTSQEKFWISQFSDEVPVLNMPYDFRRSKEQSYHGAIKQIRIESDLYLKIKKLVQRSETTDYIVFLSALMILLSKYSGQEDIIVGSPISGRTHQDTEDMMGLFINTLAMRGKPEGHKEIKRFLEEMKDICLKAYENQEYPFEELVEEVHIERDYSRNPLFDVMLVLQNSEKEILTLTDVQAENIIPNYTVSKLDMVFQVEEEQGTFLVTLNYCKDLFLEDSAERILTHYITVLSKMTEKERIRLSEIEIITESEKKQILTEFNRTKKEYDVDKTIIDLLEEQVSQNKSKTALCFGNQRITYEEFNEKVNIIAYKLRKEGIEAGDKVIIIAERSIEMIEAVYGVLKAGAAYVPVDISYPEERIRYIMSDCRPKAVLLYHAHVENIPNCKFFDLEAMNSWEQETVNPEKITKPEDLAYCIYTSGTTGRPKAVLVEHHGVVNLQRYFKEALGVSCQDRVLQFAKLIFDASVWEMNMALLVGAELVITSEDKITNIALFEEWFKKEKITVATLPPNYYLQVEKIRPRLLITAGSESNFSILEKSKGIRYVNAYGPTESTICATHWEYKGEETSLIPIGKPIYNMQIYIMQENCLCGIGVQGELCVAGVGVARGYLNQEELTKKKFVDNPFGIGKLYRTGDLARWMPDGNIEYLGRIDEQVKIRGFRIELGEIDNALRNILNVKDCAVIAKKDGKGEKELYAYFIADDKISIDKIKEQLLLKLPSYMIPTYILQLESIPMTINGKVDKKKLPTIELVSEKEYLPPANETEFIIAEYFKKVLEVDQVGRNDNFFHLGGHSLKATRLLSYVNSEFQCTILLREIFQEPTVEHIAKLVAQKTKISDKGITRAETKSFYPMSSMQKRIYLACIMDDVGLAYNMSQMIKVEGHIDSEKLRDALKKLIARYEILRTEFILHDNEPVQKILDEVAEEYAYEEDDKKTEKELFHEFVRPFELDKAPLVRVKLVQRQKNSFLMIDMHHMIGDGASMQLFIQELMKLYNEQKLESLAFQYKDYSEWMNARTLDAQKEYWKQVFLEDIPILDMPLDYNRPQIFNYVGNTAEFQVDSVLTDKIKKYLKKMEVTDYMFFLSTAMVLLHKYSRQNNIVIGSPVSGRTNKDMDNMLGVFINTLAMRGNPEKEKTYQTFLDEIKDTCIKAYDNQEYPFEQLIEDLKVKKDMSRSPLFDVMLVLQNNERPELKFGKAKAEFLRPYFEYTKYDLTFNIHENNEGYYIVLEYSNALYKKESVERILSHYIEIMQQAIEDPSKMLGDMELVSAKERKQILTEFNDTAWEIPEDKTVIDLFEQQVLQSPNRIAVVFKDKQLSYLELNQKANVLAHKLRKFGIGRNDFVAIIAERSLEMLLGIYAVLKAGGAYVPVDPAYPEERIHFMLQDCNAKVILTYHAEIAQKEEQATFINLEDEEIWQGDKSNLKKVVSKEDVAYCIYTSGTTGRPKGVMNKHVGLLNRVLWMQKQYPIDDNDTILQKTTFTFDVSVWEIVWWSIMGAKVVLLAPGGEREPDTISQTIKENNVTILHFVPSMLNSFLTFIQGREEHIKAVQSLRQVFASGEALNINTVKKFIQLLTEQNGTCLTNLYGPTEASIDVTYFDCKPDLEKVLIGKPISNIQIYMLSGEQLCAVGVPGELCIAGTGVAKGYLNQPELNMQKFVENPFGEGMLYRTGDLARWNKDGEIEYLGRIDSQVKIHGLRIELGEIESCIRDLDFIEDCVVVDIPDKTGDKVLHAYVVSNQKVSIFKIRTALKKKLAAYMIPSHIMQIDAIPVTANGKLNRRALPEIKIASQKRYVEGNTELDKALYAACAEVLGVERYGAEDNFVELGGDSMKVLKIVNILNDKGYQVTAKEMFVRLLNNL